jgi:hypothetical protein
MIYRTYGCDDCGCTFEVAHESSDEKYPDCPTCSKVLEWRPQSFNITGVKAKAIDYAQDVLEKDYGLSDFKDNNREGDVGIVRRKETRQETDLVEREVRNMVEQVSNNPEKVAQFWGQNAGQPTTMGSMTGQSMIGMAKVGPQGPDPMAMLHTGVKTGKIPSTRQMTKIIAKADL